MSDSDTNAVVMRSTDTEFSMTIDLLEDGHIEFTRSDTGRKYELALPNNEVRFYDLSGGEGLTLGHDFQNRFIARDIHELEIYTSTNNGTTIPTGLVAGDDNHEGALLTPLTGVQLLELADLMVAQAEAEDRTFSPTRINR